MKMLKDERYHAVKKISDDYEARMQKVRNEWAEENCPVHVGDIITNGDATIRVEAVIGRNFDWCSGGFFAEYFGPSVDEHGERNTGNNVFESLYSCDPGITVLEDGGGAGCTGRLEVITRVSMNADVPEKAYFWHNIYPRFYAPVVKGSDGYGLDASRVMWVDPVVDSTWREDFLGEFGKPEVIGPFMEKFNGKEGCNE